MNIQELKALANHIRFEAVRMVYEGGDGHPGPALSIADIVTTLYFDTMRVNPANPSWEDRDRFVLSKGHACPIYYAALSEKGYFGEKIEHFNLRALGSRFQGHPVMQKTPGVDMTSGSLGNGISIASGMALAAKYRNKTYRVFVIVGDGELEEGVCWEGITTAAAHNLDNMIVFVDKNGWQSGDTTKNICGDNNIAARFRSFNWHVQEINGHDIQAIRKAIEKTQEASGSPCVIVCDTVKGKGLSYMENNNAWHKGVPTKEQYEIAIKELEGVDHV